MVNSVSLSTESPQNPNSSGKCSRGLPLGGYIMHHQLSPSVRKTHSNYITRKNKRSCWFVYVTKSPELGCLHISSKPDADAVLLKLPLLSLPPSLPSLSLSTSPHSSPPMFTSFLLVVLYYSIVVSFLIMPFFKFLISLGFHSQSSCVVRGIRRSHDYLRLQFFG